MAKSRKRSDTDSSVQTSPTATAERPEPMDPNPAAERSSADEVRNANASLRMDDDHRDRVARRAYELYLSRGGSHGSDWEDWLAAERELMAGRSDDDTSRRDE
jgi:hypothetical protein